MQTISSDTVNQVWRSRARITPEDLQTFSSAMEKEQPALIAYLLAGGEEHLNEDEQALLLYLGMNIWEMMRRGVRDPRTVAIETVDAVESENLQLFQSMQGQSPEGIQNALSKMVEQHPQPYVMGYAVNILAADNQPGENIRDESKALILYLLKTLVDSLDRYQ